ncbi:hypothetical protein CC1G_09920 [Coprinopsis cinerea okayama7|uniref:MARVEL domain-containing protein n=1 Tax=Coprinopsis cinerea (strain Okayama-7 / 130 / ATCC MYA-4618 / FGSC 9003) TaxID=240176 RepID=A8NN09_COPC7|nr:hypothetical protein CC1G_09920 [Coprinopsis cinerea okayama7\|eukprot:XP_001835029.2 hypothetical protein CC1G_09920 [Coprinopsis cinerea okayama7\
MVAEFSDLGKKKVASHIFLFLFNIIVIVFATRVNKFHDFFYVADLFPLVISIITLVVLFIMLALDFVTLRSPIGVPLIEGGILGILTIIWLAFNAFSTSRWQHIPTQCNEISLAYPSYRAWCKDVQTLKAFTWVVFVMCLAITLWTLIYSLLQYKNGHKHILRTPLSQYEPGAAGSGKTADWYANGNYESNPRAAKTTSGFTVLQTEAEKRDNPFERPPPSIIPSGDNTGAVPMQRLGGGGGAGAGAPMW